MSILSRMGLDWSASDKFARALASALRATPRPGGVDLSKITLDAPVIAAAVLKLMKKPRDYGLSFEPGDIVVVRGGKTYTLMRRQDTGAAFTDQVTEQMLKSGLLADCRDDLIADVENTRRDRISKGLPVDMAPGDSWDAPATK